MDADLNPQLLADVRIIFAIRSVIIPLEVLVLEVKLPVNLSGVVEERYERRTRMAVPVGCIVNVMEAVQI